MYSRDIYYRLLCRPDLLVDFAVPILWIPISPHVGGDSTAFEPRGKRLVEDQLRLLAAGEELKNIVARG